MFSQLSDKLQEIFKDLRGHGVISEANVDAALRQVRMARRSAQTPADAFVAPSLPFRGRDVPAPEGARPPRIPQQSDRPQYL